MRPKNLTQKFYWIFSFVLFLCFFPRSAWSASNTCGPMNNQLCVLAADINGSKPPASNVLNVPVEKGKRPGLLLRFNCVGATTAGTPKDVCFPISSSVATRVQIIVDGTPTPPCTTAPSNTPNTCSYTLADTRGSLACGPSGHEPCPGPANCGPLANQQCVDTVKIVYNGDFPKNKQIQYLVGGPAPGTNGVTGVGGEIQNGQNSVTFFTKGNTPNTVSLESVFDISGSMALKTINGGTLSRMQALQDAAQILFAPSGVIDSYAIPGDKVGVVFFSDFAIPAIPAATSPFACPGLPTTPPPPPAVTNLLGADSLDNVSHINGCVQNQTPTRSTSIGAGLLLAKSGFDLDGTNANRQVLLFSDGAQNTAPNVQVVTNGTNKTVQVSDAMGANFADYPTGIGICPITAGPLVPPALDLQQQIADASCGGRNAHTPNSNQTFTAAYLETYFAQSLTAILPTDKLEIVADTTGTVARGSNTLEKFLGSPNDGSMTIALSWSAEGDTDRILPFQLKAPDGTVIDLTQRTSIARHASFTTLPFPLFQNGTEVGHKGEWQLELNGNAVHSPSLNYHLVVMADNPTIVSDFSVNAQNVGTGEQIPIRVKLTNNGAPVLNATVEAQLMGPSNSQGNVLSNTPTPSITGPGSDPASTKGQGKLDALYNNPANASLFADKNLPTLTLHDNSNTGVYTGSFTGTSNEGHYYVTIRARGTSAEVGDFQRTFWIARFVRSKPDPEKTVFKVLSYVPQTNRSVLVTLQAIPHDRFGNFLGPGYEKDMQIKSSEGTVETPLDDKLDGSYEITYRLPSSSSNPSFTVVIMGATVTTKTLRDLQGGGSPATGKFAVFFDLGVGIPHGTFGNFFNTGFSLNTGLEYIATSHFSVEGIFGYHRFPAKIAGDLNLYQFSVNGKAYLTSGTLRPFVNGGVGAYKFSPGPTKFGGNIGGGVLYTLTSRVGLEGAYNFHVIDTPGAATKFSTLQGGIRLVF
jgi:hypothetical protein